MIFLHYFQQFYDQRIEIVLKNGMTISGKLFGVDAFLNFRLVEVEISNADQSEGLQNISLLSIRGSSIKHVKTDQEENLIESLLESTRNRFIINKKREKEELEAVEEGSV